MYLVTAEEMRRMEQKIISEVGIPALLLMENAGRAVAAEVAEQARRSGQRWLVLAGKGNNGGDGLVAARHMTEAGLDVGLVYAVPKERLQGDALIQRNIVDQLGLPEIPLATLLQEKAGGKWDGVVDALLGTGTIGNPKEPYASLIKWVKQSGLPVVSVDVPSGVNVDSGAVYTPCIKADVTVTFACKKRGLLQFPAASYAGKVKVYPIQIPAGLAWEAGCRTFEVSGELFKERLQLSLVDKREEDTHKGTYGHVLIAAGSRRMLGAGLLCTRAALRGGSGLVSWALPGEMSAAVAGRVPEAMLAPLTGGAAWESVPADALLDLLPQRAALVIGPGMGQWDGDSGWLRRIWEGAGDSPLLVDADALAGLIGALLAQGHSAEEAAVLGVYRHGAAGDRAAAARDNPGSLLAGDLIEAL
ncbi:NAD(P)H-hydrate epimerase [Paenibacillus larvae]|uniref:NAD(P)H-hydrate epimerase n=1 Tax=Paenibacillus larvae TaxID=1464 RepID=UPI0028539C93|nr:NAD(P)H-hydrate epimerase [Paenibacillus larvae]MDR5584128.1 NAD(P)H-hydrate epimerase [Paenibacillus larvae]MDR5600946.1 NAD(P)H-hydrate epimerase [Paenibacillus larvae]